MLIHRICLKIHARTATDAFSGRGGLLGKGRWHTAGRLVVYSGEHTSLAMAESLVHLQRSTGVEPHVRWEINVPDEHLAPVNLLPVGWEADQEYTQAVGDAWLAGGKSVGLLVPSALVPNERNCLLNPAHPSFDLRWVVAGPIPFTFDQRLTSP